MNENNYCSLEMSKKLVDAGIMLETDVYWINDRHQPLVDWIERVMWVLIILEFI